MAESEMDLYARDDLHSHKISLPIPTLPFVNIHDYELPYGVKNMLHESFTKSHTAPSPFQFKAVNLKKEGANLLSALTGVKSEVPRHHKHWVPGCGRVRCKYDQEFTEETVMRVEDICDGKKRGKSSTKQSSTHRSKGSYVCYMVDESVDTGDLEGLVFNFDSESESAAPTGSSSSSSSEEEDDRKDKTGVVERSPEQYFALVKESMNRIGLRTQMLQDLSLGEVPPAKEAAPAAAVQGRSASGQSPAAPAEAESPYMGHTSLAVKQARKLAGLMRTDEQAVDLRDLMSWLERLAAFSEEKSKEYELRKSVRVDSTEQLKNRLQGVGGSEWRLPASPPIALQLANDDLHNRLANLFQEKNFLNNRLKSLKQEDLEEQDLENRPEEFIKALRSLEEEYELLGASVSQNLEAAERLEERYLLLEQQLNATGNSAGKHLYDVDKVKNILGPEGMEELKRIPAPVKLTREPELPPETEEPFNKSTPEEEKEDVKKKTKTGGQKSKSPDPMNNGEEKPPIRIKSAVYSRKSQSPESRRTPSPISGISTPTSIPESRDSRSTTRGVDSEPGSGTSTPVPKNLIQIIQGDSAASSTAGSRSTTATIKDDSARTRRRSRKDKAVQTDRVTILSLVEDADILENNDVLSGPAIRGEVVGATKRPATAPLSTTPGPLTAATAKPMLDAAAKLTPDTAAKPTTEAAKPPATTVKPAADITSKLAPAEKDKAKEAGGGLSGSSAPSPIPSAGERSPSASPVLDGTDPSSKVKILHNELEKSKKQLNFYRARNWAEKHEAGAVPTPITTTRPAESPVPEDQDIGLIFIYNPNSGFHTMLSSGDVGKNKGTIVRGSTVYHDKPMSAPAGSSRSSPIQVTTQNRIVSAQQVMKLIAKKREQAEAKPSTK